MNELDRSIEQSRKSRFIYTLLVGCLLCVGLFVYLIWLFLAKGYAVQIMPEEAQSSAFVRVVEGQGVYVGGALYTLSDNTKVHVGAKDFETQTLSIDPDTASIVHVTLTPSPGVLSARTEPSDKQTQWFVDGQLVHVGETLEHPIPPGEYSIQIKNKFYQPIEDTVSLKRNQTLEKVWALDNVNGQMSINTVPTNAEVFVNEQSVGRSPVNLSRSSGVYRIKVVAQGYEPTEETAEITYDTPHIERDYRLEPRKGAITLQLSPADGELIVDGVGVDRISTVGEVVVPVTANTPHSLTYSKPGYFSYQKTVKLSPGENKTVSISLKREFGIVQVKATQGTTIFINDQPVGKTTFTKKLPAIGHKLKFVLPGYRTQTKIITPSSRSTRVFDIKMLTEFEARRQEGKPLYISTLGIAMQRFRPDAYTMGSPPNQKGRKRNEFPVKVDFSRSILVSKHEITEAQYAAFDKTKANTSLPVTDISWQAAAAYCNWLSEKEGLPVFYTIMNNRVVGFNPASKGYRLLTEAEWEWLAAKAKRSAKTIYVWGSNDRIPKKAGNFADKTLGASATFYFKQYDDGFSGKAPVGSFKADRLGLFDLAGNVSEWVHDRYTNTPPDVVNVQQDYTGASRGVDYIYKGASYKSGRLSELRAAFREASKNGGPTIGFRIARYL